jgi:hypothetical protein
VLTLCDVPEAGDAQDRERDCFYCLSGWVFLGSLDHDGEEVFDAVRCRRCSGMGRMRN